MMRCYHEFPCSVSEAMSNYDAGSAVAYSDAGFAAEADVDRDSPVEEPDVHFVVETADVEDVSCEEGWEYEDVEEKDEVVRCLWRAHNGEEEDYS